MALYDDRKAVTPGMRGLARALRQNGLMPRSVTKPHPVLSALAQALSTPPAKRLGEAVAPATRLSKALSPPKQLTEALTPVTRFGEALTPVTRFGEALTPAMRLAEALAPVSPQPRLGPPVSSLFGGLHCVRPQAETRLVRVSGTHADWAKFDDGQVVGLTKC